MHNLLQSTATVVAVPADPAAALAARAIRGDDSLGTVGLAILSYSVVQLLGRMLEKTVLWKTPTLRAALVEDEQELLERLFQTMASRRGGDRRASNAGDRRAPEPASQPAAGTSAPPGGSSHAG